MGNNGKGKNYGTRRSLAGSVCVKHPDLAGQRYKNAKGNPGSCVGCSRDAASARSKRITEGDRAIRELAEYKAARPYAVAMVELERERDQLKAMIADLGGRHEVLKRAGRRVYRARDREDDRHGHPGHAHTKPGHWDKDGSPCKWCAAYERLKELCK